MEPPADRSGAPVTDEAARAAEAHHQAFAAAATVLWPLGLAGLTGVVAFLGPLLHDRLGDAAGGALHRWFAWAGSHRAGVVCAAVVLAVVGLVGVHAEPVKALFRRHGLWARVAGQVVLFLPLVCAVALLLLAVASPVIAALGVKP